MNVNVIQQELLKEMMVYEVWGYLAESMKNQCRLPKRATEAVWQQGNQ
jgi:hypothetical protein